ncbi:MAG: hypothetical protein V1809_00215 [Planctomycetota bacterium]
MSYMPNKPNKPEVVFKVGAVCAAVYLNTFEREGVAIPIRKVVVEVRFLKEGKWQSTRSLSANEIPKAIAALQKAYEYLLSGGSKNSSPPESNVETEIVQQPQPSYYPEPVMQYRQTVTKHY